MVRGWTSPAPSSPTHPELTPPLPAHCACLHCHAQLCPFFLARDLVKSAHVVFMPYNYLLDHNVSSLGPSSVVSCLHCSIACGRAPPSPPSAVYTYAWQMCFLCKMGSP